MNRKLTDRQISAVCRELLARDPATSGRSVRTELKRRFGSSGKTDRVFALWRSLRPLSAGEDARQFGIVEGLKRQISELEARVRESELARENADQRALLSEAREIAHQDRWAHEIHSLRVEVQRLAGEGDRRVELEARVLDLARENSRLQARLAQHDSGSPTVAGG